MPNKTDALRRLRLQIEAESADGLKLLDNPADNPVCTLTVDATIPCLCVSWKRYVTSAQLRYVHESMLVMLEHHHLDRILGDDTALPTIHAEDQRWITQDWMPRALKKGLKAAASKSPIAYFGKLSTDSIQKKAPEGLTIRFFDTLDHARGWLRELSMG